MTQLSTEVQQRSLHALPIAQVMQFKDEIDKTIKQWLIEGVDYGPMPNSRDAKHVLMKPGAEKLCLAFGLRADYEVVEQTIDHNIEMPYRNRYESGKALGLYRYVVKCRLRDRNGNDVFSAIGLCSTTESKYASRPRDVENTVIKMAQKRALIAAVLNGLAISGVFTQDVDEEVEAPRPTPSRQPQAHRAPAPQAAPEVVTPKPQPKAFDKNNKTHQDYFMKVLEKHNVPFEKIDDIADALHGRPSSDLEACIAEALAGDAEHQPTDAVPVAEN